ncbi:cellulose synthase (UDP-forming), glycosyl transferase family 2 [Gordonia sp. NPDC003376]
MNPDGTGGDGLPRPERTARRPVARNTNRVTAIEVIGYTLVIVFLAALALGVFDIVLPWTAP